MRFLADEGVDGTIVGSIRGNGHDVRWMAEELQGASDDVILEAAVQDARILITEDQDLVNSSIGNDFTTAALCSFSSMAFPIRKKAVSSPVPSESTRQNSPERLP